MSKQWGRCGYLPSFTLLMYYPRKRGCCQESAGFLTDTPWEVLAYGATLSDLHDIVVENMERQEKGLSG